MKRKCFDRLDVLETVTDFGLESLSDITRLLKYRLARLALQLEQASPTFDSWMFKEAELVQEVALAYGNLICWQSLLERIPGDR